MRKRSVMISTDLARALILLTIPLAWQANKLTIDWLYAVALLHGILTVFFDVSYASYLPHLIGRESLLEGNSKLSAIRSVTSISGPAIAGPLINWTGAPATLLISSAGMTASALLAMTIRKQEQKPRQRRSPSLTREIKEGWKFALNHPILLATISGDAIFNLSLTMYQTMLLLFLKRTLALSSPAIGLILSGMGCGALLGALLATRIARHVGQGRVIWLAPLLTCPPTVLVPLAHPGWSVYAAATALAALSLGGVVRVVAQSSLQQTLTPDPLLARMNATARFISWGGLPLGALLGGATGSTLGAAPTLYLGATGMTLSFLPTFLSPLRTLRALPNERDQEPLP
ncbi:protein of unknown function DUF894 DitE [Actinobacteria bacterium OK074]|nr:protein of unknown function DUF894 DitE [Actinobacteria bacterium OK074]